MQTEAQRLNPERLSKHWTQAPASELLPRIAGHWALGHIAQLRDDPLGTLARLHAQHGPNLRLNMKVRDLYVLNHRDTLKHVLLDHPANYIRGSAVSGKIIREGLGTGLLTTDGEAWKKLRQLQQPAFHYKNLEPLVPEMVATAARELQEWSRHAASGESFDSFSTFMSLTAKVGVQALFEYGLSQEESDQITHAVIAGQDRVWQRLFFPFFEIPNRPYARAVKDLTAIAGRIVQSRKGAPSKCPYTLMMSLLKGSLADQALLDQIRTMLVSAPENPSNTLAWAICRLIEHPEHQERLRAEIQSVLGDRDPGFEDLEKLSFTRRFLDEVLRLYPGAWIMDRWSVANDDALGFRIPGQRMVILSPYFVHRDPEIWPDPERFDPDRFLPERVEERPAHHYIPFGMGPRNCIGSRLALLEMQLLLPMLLRRFRFEIASPRPVPSCALVTLRPKGLRLRVTAA